jgi:hypothetical protein
MPKYSFDVILRVSPFEAENEEQAVEFLNNHLDQLCEVKNEIVQWPSLHRRPGAHQGEFPQRLKALIKIPVFGPWRKSRIEAANFLEVIQFEESHSVYARSRIERPFKSTNSREFSLTKNYFFNV